MKKITLSLTLAVLLSGCGGSSPKEDQPSSSVDKKASISDLKEVTYTIVLDSGRFHLVPSDLFHFGKKASYKILHTAFSYDKQKEHFLFHNGKLISRVFPVDPSFIISDSKFSIQTPDYYVSFVKVINEHPRFLDQGTKHVIVLLTPGFNDDQLDTDDLSLLLHSNITLYGITFNHHPVDHPDVQITHTVLKKLGATDVVHVQPAPLFAQFDQQFARATQEMIAWIRKTFTPSVEFEGFEEPSIQLIHHRPTRGPYTETLVLPDSRRLWLPPYRSFTVRQEESIDQNFTPSTTTSIRVIRKVKED